MSTSIFREGGPYNARRTGSSQYTFSIPVPSDQLGRVARTCPNPECTPGYFKVKTGTGINGKQVQAYCPYCCHNADPNDFTTLEQIRYAKEILVREAHKGIDRVLQEGLGLNSSGRKHYGGGMFSMKLSYKPGSLPHVWHPMEEEIQRAVICPYCGLDHAVFGLAVWCPDCGSDIFMVHVEAEYAVVKTMLGDIDRRRKELGPRVAARDVGNCLEDVVSIYEAVLRILLIRRLKVDGTSQEEVDAILKRIGNRLQNIDRSVEIYQNQLGILISQEVDKDSIDQLRVIFEKRHPITHNLGIVDRKYLERVISAEKEGKEIRVNQQEIHNAIDISLKIFHGVYHRLFANRKQAVNLTFLEEENM